MDIFIIFTLVLRIFLMIGIIVTAILVIVGSVVTLRELYGGVKKPWEKSERKELKRR